jgi:hypothetical protein
VAATQFDYFTKLPYDIRVLIWQIHLDQPPQKILIRDFLQPNRDEERAELRTQPNPALQLVNKDSAHQSSLVYKPSFRFKWGDGEPPVDAGEDFMMALCLKKKPRQYYFRPDLDTIVIESPQALRYIEAGVRMCSSRMWKEHVKYVEVGGFEAVKFQAWYGRHEAEAREKCAQALVKDLVGFKISQS